MTEWVWAKAEPNTIVRFVTPVAVDVLKPIGVSSHDLEVAGNYKGIVQAIYDTLCGSGIQYAREPYNSSDALQPVRTPTEVLRSPGEGTCLDLAVLFCGLCLGFNLLPVLIVLEGHALAAVSRRFKGTEWNSNDRWPELNLFDRGTLENPDTLRRLIDDGDYLLVECTGFAHSTQLSRDRPEGRGRVDGLLSFDWAMRDGREQLDQGDRRLWHAFDVVRLQQDGGLAALEFTPPQPPGVELLRDVGDYYRNVLVNGLPTGIAVPTRWDARQLGNLRDALVGTPEIREETDRLRLLDVTTALCNAVEVKALLEDVGASRIGLGRLCVIYRREIRRWPEHDDSSDGILVDAAGVDILERREGGVGGPPALARYVLSLCVECGVNVSEHHGLLEWLASVGVQGADASSFAAQRDSAPPAWLLVDLGPEVQVQASGGNVEPWPQDVSARLFMPHDQPLTLFAACVRTEEGIIAAIRKIVDDASAMVSRRQEIVVDVAAPRWLLERIDEWQVVEDDGEYVPLREGGLRPRLRWSQRAWDGKLARKAQQRAREVVWRKSAALLGIQGPTDKLSLVEWLDLERHRAPIIAFRSAYFVGDPLRIMLGVGCPFLVWLPEEATPAVTRLLSAVTKRVPFSARSYALPDEIALNQGQEKASGPNKIVTIWDDPGGREGYCLPPRVQLQGPSS
jgi:hypothetical protein